MNRAQKISFFAALFAILICIVMLLPIFLQPLDTIAAEEKRIDMYLIGGQSNAAGYTKTESGTGVEKQTFDAVLYGGQVDKQRADGRPGIQAGWRSDGQGNRRTPADWRG